MKDLQHAHNLVFGDQRNTEITYETLLRKSRRAQEISLACLQITYINRLPAQHRLPGVTLSQAQAGKLKRIGSKPFSKFVLQNLFTRIADHIGLRDIDFEMDEFNKAFNVKCKDRKFANDLIDQRMMRWLLAADGAFNFEVCNTWMLCFSKRRKPQELIPLLGTLKGFHDTVPRVVYELYGQGWETAPQPEPPASPPPPPPVPPVGPVFPPPPSSG